MIPASLERLPATLSWSSVFLVAVTVVTVGLLYWGRWLSPRYAPSRAGKGYMIAVAVGALGIGLFLVIMYRSAFADSGRFPWE